MTISEEVAHFAAELTRSAEKITTDIRLFPSGAVNLDVRWGDRMFVLAYFPTYKMFGVDEIREDDGIGTDFQFGFEDFQSAKAKLLSMVEEAGMSGVRKGNTPSRP